MRTKPGVFLRHLLGRLAHLLVRKPSVACICSQILPHVSKRFLPTAVHTDMRIKPMKLLKPISVEYNYYPWCTCFKIKGLLKLRNKTHILYSMIQDILYKMFIQEIFAMSSGDLKIILLYTLCHCRHIHYTRIWGALAYFVY